MEVEYGVDALCCACVHDFINKFKSFRFDNRRIEIVNEMPMVDGYTERVKA
jgi:hypothetical protein